MAQLAEPLTFAASLAMVIAALRLWAAYDPKRGRHHIVLTLPLILHLFLSSVLHGAAALTFFLPYGIWPESWRPLFSADPWFLAWLSPLIVNGFLALEGIDPMKAIGKLVTFVEVLIETLEQEMVEAEDIILSALIVPLAKGESLFAVRRELLDNIPLMLSTKRANAARAALDGAESVTRAMEFFIRHVGKRKFLALYAAKLNAERPALAPTPLFDVLEKPAA